MSASIVQRYARKGTGADYPRPQPRQRVKGGVADVLAHRLACSPKAAQSRMDRARALLPQIIGAAQEAGATDWLRWWFLESDALRAGPRLTLQPWLLAAVSRQDTTEDQTFVEMVLDPTNTEKRAAWLRSLESEITAKQELLAAAKGEAFHATPRNSLTHNPRTTA